MIRSSLWFAAGALSVVLSLGPVGQVITYDQGGPIGYRAALIEAGAAPEIAGWCASACTMHLTGGCVWPDAVLVFHGPVTDDPAAFEHWSGVMARHYPPAIRDWYLRQGRHGEWRMTGAEAIRQGAQACGADKQ